MCAIAGIINKKESVDATELKRMADAMILRGPDEGGIFVDGNIGLAHRRLSIIDLKTGQQPMYSADRQCVIVFNGEIYNFQQIRAELQREGVAFSTTSDTEVLLNGYIHYGIDKILSLIDGMFTFAIYDKRCRKVFLARDRFGEKPLYYIANENSFTFASELKAFGSTVKGFKIDPIGLNLYLSLLYIPAPYTIYEGVRKLEQSTYLVISEDCKVEPHRYYDIYAETSCPDETISYEEAKKRVRELVYDSVKLRMISDVPMGTFLSGGLDSSIVSCVMSQLSKAPINTFSIGYEEKEYDESDRALAVSKHIKSNHTQFTLHYNDVLDSIDDIISYYDEPFSDQSAIPTYMVAKLASQKVKVVLTGDTADEIWGGYGKYNKFKMVCKCAEYPAFARNLLDWGLNLCPKIPQTASKIRSARKMLAYAKLSESDAYYSLNCGGSPDSYRAQMLKGEYYRDVRPVLGERYCTFNHFSNFQKQSVWDIVTQLEGQMLQKVDRACMHVSLENRTPFLDKRLVKLALSLPDSYKMDGYDMKKILWDTFSDILPVEILRLPKKGFGVPVANWLKNELRSDFEKLTSKEFLEEQGIFDYEYVHRLFTDHLTELVSNGQALWNIYVFQKWYNRWVLK